MNYQDIQSGVDFTGISGVDGSDLNTGINFSTPLKDTDETVGKGLILTTTDSAANTPNVPDPTSTLDFTKWKRYKWCRRPFAGSSDKSSIDYSWNDDAANDPVYLKWVRSTPDLTSVTSLANNALATADNAVAEASVANDTANQANATANDANTTSANANSTANTANTTANAAQARADSAFNLASIANTTANSAVTLNTTPIDINQRLSPSATAYQKIRTKSDASGVEWFSEKDYYIKLTEIYAKGTDNPVAAASGKNTRVLNNVDNNSGNLVSLNTGTGVITFNVAGVYKLKCYNVVNRSGSNPLTYQSVIANNVSNDTLLTGASGNLANGNTNNVNSVAEGLITVAANDTIRLDLYTSTATGVVLGKAADVHPDSGGHEVYSYMELTFLGV